LPFDIPADEFEKIIPLIAGEEKSLLAQWYRRDDNAIPPVYLLQPRGNEFVEYENWEKIETKLRQVFLTAVGRLSLSPDALLKYTASATEQEIVAGALKVLDASEHVFCFLRDIQGLPSDASAAAFCETDPQAARQQSELKTRLRQSLTGNVHEYSARWQSNGPSQEHLDQLCEDVYAELSKVILSEVGLLETVDPLEKEISAHEIFGKERARVFRGRPDILKAVEKYIAGSDQHVLAVWGASGSGKSALMAKAIEQAREKGKDVVYRFIGATPESSNGRALLESLCEQISHRYGADESTIPA
jgi:primosomal protein N'